MKMEELGIEYENSAALLKQRLKELRAELKQEVDPEKRFKIERRIATLTPMYTDCRKLAKYCKHYYERGFYISNGAFGERGGVRFTSLDKAKVSGATIRIDKRIDRQAEEGSRRMLNKQSDIFRGCARTRSKQKHCFSELLCGIEQNSGDS